MWRVYITHTLCYHAVWTLLLELVQSCLQMSTLNQEPTVVKKSCTVPAVLSNVGLQQWPEMVASQASITAMRTAGPGWQSPSGMAKLFCPDTGPTRGMWLQDSRNTSWQSTSGSDLYIHKYWPLCHSSRCIVLPRPQMPIFFVGHSSGTESQTGWSTTWQPVSSTSWKTSA